MDTNLGLGRALPLKERNRGREIAGGRARPKKRGETEGERKRIKKSGGSKEKESSEIFIYTTLSVY